jgi:hypothetical protein
MARDRFFSLDLDVNNPKDKVCKDKNGDAPELSVQEYQDLLKKGDVIGVLFRGSFATPTAEGSAANSTDEILAPKCVVVYIGGTAYKICS